MPPVLDFVERAASRIPDRDRHLLQSANRIIQVDREEIAEAIAALSAGKGLVDNPDYLWYPSAQWYTPI